MPPETNGHGYVEKKVKSIAVWIFLGVSIGSTFGVAQLQIARLEKVYDGLLARQEQQGTEQAETRTQIALIKQAMEYMIRNSPATSSELKQMKEELIAALKGKGQDGN